MPRSEFKARDFWISELRDMTDLQLQDLLRDGLITRKDISLARKKKTPIWEGSEDEDLSQEVPPVEEDPRDGTSVVHNPLSPADHRRAPGSVTTQRHIAERYGAEDTPLH